MLGTVPLAVAAIQATEAIKLLVGDSSSAGRLTRMDLWCGSFGVVEVERDGDCPTCGQGNFEYLTDDGVASTAILCGRFAVQITPPREIDVDIEQLREVLSRVGPVHYNGLIVACEVDGMELVVFRDGRAIVKGTGDETVARALCAKYMGY